MADDYRRMTLSDMRALLVAYVELSAELAPGRVLIETKTAHRPSDGLYATLWFKNLEPLVQTTQEFDSTDNEESNFADNESSVTVQINFWGANAYDVATKVMQDLSDPARFFDLWKLIGFAGVDSVQDISTEFGGKIQQRAYFNLDFYICLGRTYPADWFNVAKLGITFPDKPYTEEWEIPKED